MTLTITKASKRFSGVVALNSFTACFPNSSVTVILGPNGAGKTTLFDVLTGYLQPDEGEVVFDGERVTGLAPHILAARGLGRLFQKPRVFPTLTVEENLLVALAAQPGEGILCSVLHPMRVRKSEVCNRKSVQSVLDRFQLTPKALDLAATLSFGQQRLLSLARLLLADCRVFLLDEPVAGIHVGRRFEIAEILKSLKDSGKTVIIIDHDPGFSLQFADQVLLLEEGRLVSESSGGDWSLRITEYLKDSL